MLATTHTAGEKGNDSAAQRERSPVTSKAYFPTPEGYGVHALQRKLQALADGSPQVNHLLDQHSRMSQAAVVQGKWFRMSTILDERDKLHVSLIQQMVREGNYRGAFFEVVKPHQRLRESFLHFCTVAKGSEDAFEAMMGILSDTFDEEGKAYTAAEVLAFLEENQIIQEAEIQLEDSMSMDEDIDVLIDMFSELSIEEPFFSDVDDGAEMHKVYIEDELLMVASNPKPIKQVVDDEEWEGYELNAGQVLTLKGLADTAKNALYQISGKAKKKIKGSRTKTKMEDLRLAMKAIAKFLRTLAGKKHEATLMPITDLSSSTNHGSDGSPTEGKKVVANPLTIKSATAGSGPHDGRLMESIRNLAGDDSKSYKQMHLLNDLVYGPGQLWNLTPGPAQSNVDMEKQVEDPLKRAVLGKGLVIKFEAKVNYKNDPTTASDKEIRQSPDKYRFESIDFKAQQWEYKESTMAWNVATTQDSDVAAVNGARILWKYGSLTPLVPKPRILDPRTTWQELNAVGVPPAAAKRIVAYVNANHPVDISGVGKQQQLANAVKEWDEKSRGPDIKSWKATAVLWT